LAFPLSLQTLPLTSARNSEPRGGSKLATHHWTSNGYTWYDTFTKNQTKIPSNACAFREDPTSNYLRIKGMTVLLHRLLGSWLDSNLNVASMEDTQVGTFFIEALGPISRWLLVTEVCQQKAGTN